MADDITKTIPVSSGSTIPAQSVPVSGAQDIPEEDPFDDVKKDVRKRFELLPEEIQKAIMDDNYQMQLFEIAKAHKLTYEQLSYLEMKTTMVLLGMLPPEDYRDNLQVELKQNDPEIDSIVTNVNEKVFAPIRASIQKVYAVQNDAIDDLNKDTITEMTAPRKVIMPIVEQAPMPKTTPFPSVQPSLSSAEKTVLEKTGVVISETPAPMRPSAPSAPISSRNDILAGIENPVRTPRPDIVANKLSGVTPVTQTKTTDYSIPKTTAPATPPVPPARPLNDPYRERVE